MNQNFFLRNVVFILMISVVAWAGEVEALSEADLSKNQAVYTEENQNIIVTNNQTSFTLKLRSNPTTGYSWFLRNYDTNLLVPIKHEFQKPSKKLMGAPGYELWVFQIKKNAFIVPQQTTVRMVYTRPWQAQDSATQIVFRVTIQGR